MQADAREQVPPAIRKLLAATDLHDDICARESVRNKHYAVSILVDCYSIYTNIYRYFSMIYEKYGVADSALTLDEIVQFVRFVMPEIERDIARAEITRRSLIEGASDYAQTAYAPDRNGSVTSARLLSACMAVVDGREQREFLDQVSTVIHFDYSFDLFFAPFPRGNILNWYERHLKDARAANDRTAIERLQPQYSDAQHDIVTLFGERRDYSIYRPFIESLFDAVSTITSTAEKREGQYKFYISEQGLKKFTEKQVDVKITMRAMDRLHEGADAICIVSSDTDFLPVLQRFSEEQCGAYQCNFAAMVPGHRMPPEFRSLARAGMYLVPRIDARGLEVVAGAFARQVGAEKAAAIREEIGAQLRDDAWNRRAKTRG